MPPTIVFSLPPAEAVRLGLPYFDMFIVGWGGSSDVYGDNSGIIYPFASTDVRLPAPRGIAIHPQSEIDRVLIETSIGVGVDTTVSKVAAVNSLSFSASVDAPLILAPPTMMVPASPGGAVPAPTVVLRAHPDAIWHTQYAKSGTSTLSAFNTALIPGFDEPDTRTAFMSPILALRFYLQTPPSAGVGRTSFFQPAQRAPGLAASTGGAPLSQPIPVNAAETPGEQLFAIIPIHGRRCGVVAFRATDCTPTIRIAVLDFTQQAPLDPVTQGSGRVQLERTQFTSTALTSDVPVQVPINPFGDWLMLYYTPGDGDDGLLQWTLRMT